MTEPYADLRVRLYLASKKFGANTPERMRLLSEAESAISTLLDRCIALEGALERCISFLETAPLESGTCCCGSPVEGHGFGDGHSPVDELQYHASNLAQDARTALTGEAR